MMEITMTRVLLLRHAETAVPSVFHGVESDVELSAKGRRQAALVADAIAVHRPHAVISSAMRRAVDTARTIAAACRVPHLLEPKLHERRVGSLSGMPHAGNEIWRETAERWNAGQTHWAHDGAESFDDIRRRVWPVWDRVTRDYAGRTLVLVAHGIVCKVLLLSLFPDWTWTGLGSIRNTAITELFHDGQRWTAVRVNQWPDAIAALD